ncbi:MAG TPA: hypothetical protein VMH01_01300, partial [Puia sp.]|nr:hypothetical protein [Puia sp.]
FLKSSAAIQLWTGAGGDGQWSNPSNWNGNAVPAVDDDVLLDNSFLTGSYVVSLPNTAVTIKSLTITPGFSDSIFVILPSSNTSAPAFSVTGPGYGLTINARGIFQNASGLASGEPLVIADSIRINDGGKYIHHTRASHANNIVRLLSIAPGTENGIFEFDVPRASYTVSVSNRTYGTLVFSSIAAGGTVNYTCNGSNTLTIRGNLQINDGVSFNVDLGGVNGNIKIKGDYIQNGGVFNLASGAGNLTVVSIRGNLFQSATGRITETNTGLPAIELNGSSPQNILLAGIISNSISFRMNNPAGAILSAPLQLPFLLQLLQGKITTSSLNLLTLQSGCGLITDSTSSTFIDGPMRKEGLSSTPFFLFPVGKNNEQRWLELKNATGNFTIEYIKNNPRLLSNTYGPGIDHVSSNEYWTIGADANPLATANVELSFVFPGSGVLTDLSFLHVASLLSTTWTDDGQISTTGDYITSGSVVSNPLSNFPVQGFFTLASTANLQNPLPSVLIDFKGRMADNQILFDWQVDMPGDADYFELMIKERNDFRPIGKIQASPDEKQYRYNDDSVPNSISYYRLRVTDKTGISYLSKIIAINNNKSDFTLLIAPTVIVGTIARVQVNAAKAGNLQWVIVAMDGRILKRGSFNIEPGSNHFSLDLERLAAGVYELIGVNEKKQFYSVRFVKE